jgi:hypothetical protein
VKEDCRLRVFESRVLRRIFGVKTDEARGEWRRLHNEELNDLYCDQKRRIRWVGNVALLGEKSDAYKVSAGKPEGQRSL